jgi:rSAM/selenodomain-associated transferase 1
LKLDTCLIIFAKEPQKGRVKTRLAEHLGDDKSLALYKALLKDTLNLVRRVEVDKKILAYESFHEDPKFLRNIAGDFSFYNQEGHDLGERMHNAFGRTKKLGALKSIIVGSDAPTLPPSFIKEAFNKLDKFDIVIGPTNDGGYYLVGLKDPCIELFQDVVWSSDTVLDTTVSNAERLGKSIDILNSWYDIDTIDDFESLRQNVLKYNNDIASHTRDFFESSCAK